MERNIVNKCLEILNKHGKAIKIHGNEFMEAGTPDIIGCVHGYTVVIECKQPGKKPTKIQEHRLAQWKAARAITAVVTHPAQLTPIIERTLQSKSEESAKCT